MNKPVRIILIDDAKDAYTELNTIAGEQQRNGKKNSQELQLLRAITAKKNILKQNPFYGDNIPKNLIPKSYHVDNLWRIELPGFWRMLYTIKGDEIEIICFILDIIDHDTYNKKFKYKKS